MPLSDSQAGHLISARDCHCPTLGAAGSDYDYEQAFAVTKFWSATWGATGDPAAAIAVPDVHPAEPEPAAPAKGNSPVDPVHDSAAKTSEHSQSSAEPSQYPKVRSLEDYRKRSVPKRGPDDGAE